MNVDLKTEDTRDLRRRERLRDRYAMRDLVQTFSHFERIATCGRRRVSADHGVGVWLQDGEAHYANLQTCASVHACPVCAPKIRQRRADEITQAVEAHQGAGGGVEFVTLTLPHDQGDELAGLLDAISLAWQRVLGGRGWQHDRELYGVGGTIRALEVNHGKHGWHPHLHVLVFTARQLNVHEREDLRRSIFRRWEASVVRSGYRAPLLGPGCKVVPVRDADGIGQYTSKVVGLELQRHDLKVARRARAGYRSAFAIAADLVRYGDAEDLTLWWEYEAATHGRRALTWSRGLKAWFRVGEATDDEIAAEEVGGELVGVIGAETWNVILRRRLRHRVLVVAQEHGADGLAEWLAKLEADVYEIAGST